jgi:hypothetical protein
MCNYVVVYQHFGVKIQNKYLNHRLWVSEFKRLNYRLTLGADLPWCGRDTTSLSFDMSNSFFKSSEVPGRSVRTGCGPKSREIAGKWTQEYDVHSRWLVFPASGENRLELSTTWRQIRVPYWKSLEPASGIIEVGWYQEKQFKDRCSFGFTSSGDENLAGGG